MVARKGKIFHVEVAVKMPGQRSHCLGLKPIPVTVYLEFQANSRLSASSAALSQHSQNENRT